MVVKHVCGAAGELVEVKVKFEVERVTKSKVGRRPWVDLMRAGRFASWLWAIAEALAG